MRAPDPITIERHHRGEVGMRSSHSTQLATAKAIADRREEMVDEWAKWLAERTAAGSLPTELVERELALVIVTLVEMLGPLRREAQLLWDEVMEHYGRTGAARGLAAGEVVDEIQQLRVLLIKHIGTAVAAMRPRRAVAVFIRLSNVVDRGISQAVVGYTDALVASLMLTEAPNRPLTEATPEDFERQLSHLEHELAAIAARR
jgi:hypothetical protein